MIEIIPNWHPIFVHFTVALVASSALFFIGSTVLSGRGWSDHLKIAGHWTLRLGALATVFTLAAGLQAYGSVDHDAPSHAAMTNHRNWAFVTVGFIWLSAIWSVRMSKGTSVAGALFFTLLGVATIMVGMTAYKGGELVYRYGLGVQSLPKSEGDGHDHDHGAVAKSEEGHGHDEGVKDDPEHDETELVKSDEDHEHTDSDSDAHEHGETDGVALESDPAATADAFHLALMTGDESAVKTLLAEDVVILESGHAQHSREEYMSGHMKSDMAFLPNIERQVIDRSVSKSGNLGWVITHSRMVGEYNGQPIDMPSREMLMMAHDGKQWQITLVHWGDK